MVVKKLLEFVCSCPCRMLTFNVAPSLVNATGIAIQYTSRHHIKGFPQAGIEVLKPGFVGALAETIPHGLAIARKPNLLQSGTEVREESYFGARPAIVMSFWVCMWSNHRSPTPCGIAEFMPQKSSETFYITSSAMSVMEVKFLHLQSVPEDF